MSANNYNGDLVATRKLTDEEVTELRGLLVKDLKYSPEEQEDVDDLLDYTFAMVSNGKALSYVVQELVSMEMDVCQEPQAHGIAMQIAKYLEENVNRVQVPIQDDDEEEEEHHVVSLKSSETEANALTMSGALGASRERGKKDDGRKQQSGGDRKDNNRQRGGAGRQGNDRRGRGRGRMNASEAFERLSGNRNDRRGGGGRRDDRRSDQGRPGRGGGGRGDMRRGGGRDMGRGGRGDMGRGGRGDMGRGGRGDMGRGGGRGSPNQRGGRGGRNAPPVSGTRRSRDEMRGEEDFIPAGQGGRGDGRFGGRGGRGGGDGGRGGRYDEGNKRQRMEDWGQQQGGYSDNYYDESWGGYDEGYNDYNWRGGGFRGGGRGGRGRGRGRGGRGGRGGEAQGAVDASGEGAEASDAPQAAASHPSPIVAASFGGRAYRGRGRGRGRGGRSNYRAQVASMIASKSWVRPKAEGEAGDKGGGDSKQNGDGAADASEG